MGPEETMTVREWRLRTRVVELEAEILMLRALLSDGRDGHRTKAWHVAVAAALDEPEGS